MSKEHPAKFTDTIIYGLEDIICDEIEELPPAEDYQILDPFAGVGGIHRLANLPQVFTYGIEIEPEWANESPRTRVGSALALPFDDERFDAIVTSPTYGNRMADSHEAKDGSKRITYKHVLGHSLNEANSGSMQWGHTYRLFHYDAWVESLRVLKPGGLFVVNIKNHIRGGEVQRVTEWHLKTLIVLGLYVEEIRKVPVSGMGFGANRDARVPFESIIVMRKPS